jgi:hypothetical protein
MAKRSICIIGNSHVAALRAGMELVPKLMKNFSLDFFAAQSDMLRELELKGTMLVPTSEPTRQRMSAISGGRSEIETSNYLHFVVVGLRFNFVEAVNVLRHYRLYGLNGTDGSTSPYLSRACFAAFIESKLRASTAVYLAGLLRKVSRGQIVLIPQPYPGADVLRGSIWKLAAGNGALTYAAQQYENIARRLANDLQFEVLFQPPGTLLQPGITQGKYAVDSVRLGNDMNARHPPGEAAHMNASFGAAVLRQYLGSL